MNNAPFEFPAPAGERLDKAIVAHVGDSLSRAQIQTLIKDGMVTVNGEQVKPGIKLRGGETIHITIPEKPVETLQPEAIPLNVLYEDEQIVVIDKPAGLIVHPGVGNETGTLVHAMLSRWPDIARMNNVVEKRMGIVHRLDKDTSGLIVIAKNDSVRRKLSAQFQERTVEKVYIALLERIPQTRTGRIEAPIGRDPNQRKRMAVVRGGKPAITEYTVVEDDFLEDRALVRVKLLTGRTHQIRVHMAFIGCPIVGDTVYGFRKQRIKIKRHFLHAAELSFDHPTSGERMHFESPLPASLQEVLEKLRQPG